MRVIAVGLLVLPALAHGQFKCTDAQGQVSFQQVPCANSQAQQSLKLRSDQPARPGSSAGVGAESQGGSVEQRMLKTLERERRVRELEREIADTESAISQRSSMMSNELAALQSRKHSAYNNLAGATWEQSISTEMQAITAKYRVLNDVDAERLKVLRADLAAAKLTAKG